MSLAGRTYLALVHHPVLNRDGRVVATAITNLDLHDIARASRTYGLGGYFVVTPVERQQALITRILSHWQTGMPGEQNAARRAALERVRVVPDLEALVAWVSKTHACRPILTATAARPSSDTVSWQSWARDRGRETRPAVLLFGTGWGLADAALALADLRLEPIWGPTDYNHLSVRSAVAICLDRLFGRLGPE